MFTASSVTLYAMHKLQKVSSGRKGCSREPLSKLTNGMKLQSNIPFGKRPPRKANGLTAPGLPRAGARRAAHGRRTAHGARRRTRTAHQAQKAPPDKHGNIYGPFETGI